jgi:hypothetical protein
VAPKSDQTVQRAGNGAPCTDRRHLFKKKLNPSFQKIEKNEVKVLRTQLSNHLANTEKTHIKPLEDNLVLSLSKEGFTRVSTPTVITGAPLKK